MSTDRRGARFVTPLLHAALLVGLGAAGSLSLGVACKVTKTTLIWDTGDTGASSTADRDGDGFAADVDCDDQDPNTYPGAPERCDGRNNDCDAGVDEEPVDGRSFHQDADLDGYGNPDVLVQACERSPGFVEEGTDCDDGSALVNPGQAEVCNDGLDNNCDGELGACDRSGNLSLAEADATLLGVSTGDQAGASVASVGDMDGDGRGELAVGAPRADARGADSGVVYLLSTDVVGERGLDSAELSIAGPTGTYGAGGVLAPVGDVNDDGYADLLVGTPLGDGGGIDSGGAFLFLGPPGAWSVLGDATARLIGDVAYDTAGGAVAAGGDLTGDGVVDLLIGAEGYGDGGFQAQGALYVVSSDETGELRLRAGAGVVVGEARYDRLGASGAAAGDFNGDGVGDLAAGAVTWSSNEGTGRVYLVEGPISGRIGVEDAAATLDGEGLLHNAGRSLSAGDINGDGLEDLVVGAPGYDALGEGQGAVYVLYGPLSGTGSLAAADARIEGAAAGDALGTAVDVGGDSNGDGRNDLWVGAPGHDRAADNAGAAALFSRDLLGALSWEDAPFKVFGVGVDERAGQSLSMAGDQNGDGLADALIGAPGLRANGGAYLVLSVGL